jgi:large conductance mechanosensitive channel
MFKDFKTFILRGNVVDLAVGVVIGVAFGTVITSFVKDLLTPLVSIGGKTNFASLKATVHHSVFLYGDFLNALIAFVIIALAVFFVVVLPVNKLVAMRKTQPDPASLTRDCPMCLSSIPEAASRCAFCTAEVEPVGAVDTADATGGTPAGAAPATAG